MSTTPRTHIDALTGMRAYAALSVLAFHAWLNAGHPALVIRLGPLAVDLAPYAKFGWLGVDIFFVLSGFLLTRVAFDRVAKHADAPSGATPVRRAIGEGYASYLRRRVLRVFPAYYACLTVLLLMGATGAYRTLPGDQDMLLHLLMSHNLVENYIVSMNGVFWTLPFEWTFYLVFPFLFMFLQRFGPAALYATAVVVVLLTKAQVMWADDGYAQLLLLIRLDAFCMGMAASALSLRYPMRRATAYAAMGVGALLLLALPYVFARQPGVVHYYDLGGFLKPFWMHLGIALLLCALTGTRTRFNALFDNALVVWIGTISYSLYLWHLPVIEILPSLGWGADLATPSGRGYAGLVFRTLLIVVPIAAASYYFVERPFQSAGATRSSTDGRTSPARPITVLAIWGAALLATTIALNAMR